MHTPRKRFGQHFLHDRGVIARILEAIDPHPGEAMVEIGPGLGAITLPLLQILGELTVVEIDRDVIRELEPQARPLGTLRIFLEDALEFDFTQLATGQRLRIVGNLPYNISTPLLFHLIKQREICLDMHFMLQKEVVDRMAAAPDTGDYGRLTVMLAPWLTVTPLFDVGAGAFRPPPRVTSSVVRLQPRAEPLLPASLERAYATVVAAAFAQRRKTLRNALRALLPASDIEQAGIDPGVRAETLPPTSFVALAYALTARAGRTVAPNDDPPLG
jgi:16S rRNA (adenine1518-N6/adenine1519-N6)-dimethyltransferase